MKKIGSLAVVLAVAVAGAGERSGDLLQRSQGRDASRASPLASEERNRRAGGKLYQRECSACHGAEGLGLGHAPPVASPRVQQSAPGTLYWVITNGSLRHGMPSFAHLAEGERWQIVEYLKNSVK